MTKEKRIDCPYTADLFGETVECQLEFGHHADCRHEYESAVGPVTVRWRPGLEQRAKVLSEELRKSSKANTPNGGSVQS